MTSGLTPVIKNNFWTTLLSLVLIICPTASFSDDAGTCASIFAASLPSPKILLASLLNSDRCPKDGSNFDTRKAEELSDFWSIRDSILGNKKYLKADMKDFGNLIHMSSWKDSYADLNNELEARLIRETELTPSKFSKITKKIKSLAYELIKTPPQILVIKPFLNKVSDLSRSGYHWIRKKSASRPTGLGNSYETLVDPEEIDLTNFFPTDDHSVRALQIGGAISLGILGATAATFSVLSCGTGEAISALGAAAACTAINWKIQKLTRNQDRFSKVLLRRSSSTRGSQESLADSLTEITAERLAAPAITGFGNTILLDQTKDLGSEIASSFKEITNHSIDTNLTGINSLGTYMSLMGSLYLLSASGEMGAHAIFGNEADPKLTRKFEVVNFSLGSALISQKIARLDDLFKRTLNLSKTYTGLQLQKIQETALETCKAKSELSTMQKDLKTAYAKRFSHLDDSIGSRRGLAGVLQLHKYSQEISAFNESRDIIQKHIKQVASADQAFRVKFLKKNPGMKNAIPRFPLDHLNFLSPMNPKSVASDDSGLALVHASFQSLENESNRIKKSLDSYIAQVGKLNMTKLIKVPLPEPESMRTLEYLKDRHKTPRIASYTEHTASRLTEIEEFLDHKGL